MKIAIIGGGISGLSTAFYLKNENLQIDIFEKSNQCGGKMKTQQIDDFYFEHGTNGFLSNKPDTLKLVHESNAQDLLLKSNDLARIRFIYTNALYQMPESPKEFFKTKLLSFGGKIRVLLEPLMPVKKNDDDESLQDFGYRRVGKEMTNVFLDAFTAGVYASTPEQISVNSAFPMVVALEKEYGGLFAGMIKKKKKQAGPGGVLMSFKNGVSSFITHLEKTCGANIFTNSCVQKIEKIDNGYVLCFEDKKIFYDKVILATPSFISAKLVRNFDENLAQKLDKISYSPISVVGFGYNNLSHELKGFGLLTTKSAQLGILGVLWDSSIFTDRAKNGKKCLRVMIGGQRNKELALKSEEELINIAKQGIKKTMGIDDMPDVTFVKKYEHGIPSYELGHEKNNMDIFNALSSHEGLFLNSNAYKGIALNDCVKNSKICAEEVINTL